VTNLTMDQVKDMFNEMLDECWKPITIAERTFYSSEIVKACDPIMYRVMLSDFEDSLQRDGHTIEDEVF